MDKKKILLYVQAALCVLWVVLMAAAAIHIYSEGLAYQAQGHPEVWIYTREKAAEAIGRYLPVLLLAGICNVACVAMGARDEGQDKPVADPELISIYKKEREAAALDAGTKAGTGAAAEDARAGAGPEAAADPARRIRLVRIAIFAAAVAFVIAGAINGSMEDMLIKAVNICTECVGLG